MCARACVYEGGRAWKPVVGFGVVAVVGPGHITVEAVVGIGITQSLQNLNTNSAVLTPCCMCFPTGASQPSARPHRPRSAGSLGGCCPGCCMDQHGAARHTTRSTPRHGTAHRRHAGASGCRPQHLLLVLLRYVDLPVGEDRFSMCVCLLETGIKVRMQPMHDRSSPNPAAASTGKFDICKHTINWLACAALAVLYSHTLALLFSSQTGCCMPPSSMCLLHVICLPMC
jgi:hypothetical protein